MSTFVPKQQEGAKVLKGSIRTNLKPGHHSLLSVHGGEVHGEVLQGVRCDCRAAAWFPLSLLFLHLKSEITFISTIASKWWWRKREP